MLFHTYNSYNYNSKIKKDTAIATRYEQIATQQVDPLYQQQIQATQAQLPAIQKLYQSLTQGLEGQQQTETQNILESASQRGVLRSTLPVDLQTSLAGAFAQKRGELALNQTRDVADVQSRIASLGLDRVKTIQSIADALEQKDFEREKLAQQQRLAEQELAIKRQEAATRGGTREPSQTEKTQLAAQALAAELGKVAGRDGYVSPQNYAAARREWLSAGFSSKVFNEYFSGFKNPKNLNYQYY